MLNFKEKKTYIILLVIFASLATLYFVLVKKPKITYDTVKVQQGTLYQTVSEVGAIKRQTDVNLNFLAQGRIATITVAIGEKVAKGQLLAQLDYSNLQIQIKQAEANLLVAKANEQKVLRGATSLDVAISSSGVSQAETGYKNALNDYEKSKATTDEAVFQANINLKNLQDLSGSKSAIVQAVKSAQTSFANTKSTYQKSIDNRRSSGLVTIRDKNLVAKTAIDTVNRVLTDDGASNTLSIQNTALLTLAKEDFNSAEVQKIKADQSYLKAVGSKDPVVIGQAFEDSRLLLSDAQAALGHTFSVLENTVTSSKLTQGQLDALKSSVSGQLSAVNSAIALIESARQALDDAILSYETAMSGSEQALSSAQASLDGAIQNAQNSLNSAKLSQTRELQSAQSRIDASLDAIKLAQAQLNKTSATSRPEDIALVNAQVKQAQANLDAVKNQINNNTIISPFAGVVTQINYSVGEEASVSKPVIVLLGNDQFEIEVDIAESDIAKVAIGNKCDITIDAFGDSIKFVGELSRIDPGQTVLQEVVYYKSAVSSITPAVNGLDSYLKQIKPGMTANVTIMATKKDGVIIVPNRSIIDKGNNAKIVRVLRGQVMTEVPVVVGMRGDDGLTEILSGLTVNEDIVLAINDSSKK